MQKTIYEQPTTKVLVIRVENRIMLGSNTASSPSALPSFEQDYDDWD